LLVAVVDDDPRVLESLDELLAAGGYKALLFPSAEAFLDSNAFRQVDCLISDIGMPAMNGWELAQTARSEQPGLPVILITGRDGEHPKAWLEGKGIRRLFRKPFDGGELLGALDTILR
jgi:FixJ family two-component response regulator